jgi:S-DNA-T family DNA segregation ATPase FtsK/SpoIIIE
MSHPTSTDHAPAAGGGEVIDLLAYMDPEVIDHAEQRARERVQATPAGVADLTTGSVDLTKAEAAPADGGVLEQPEDTASSPARPVLRKIVPDTFRDPGVWRHRRAVAANAALFHLTRSPVYLWRTAGVTALGARVGIRDAWSYLFATEYGELADKVRRTNAGAEHIADRRREPVTVYSATAASAYVGVLLALGMAWSLVLVFPTLVPLLGTLYGLGRRELTRRGLLTGVPYAVLDDPAAGPIEAGKSVLTDTLLNRALRTAGVFTKDEQEIRLTTPIRQAEINGVEAAFRAEGVTVSKLWAKSEGIAGALDVPEDWIDIRSLGSPGHISFWMTDTDPFAEHRPSPLLTHTGTLDSVNDGIPASFDKRGQSVMLKLHELMMLVGGATRAGKGLVLRNLICGAALDPRVRIRIATGKKPAEHSVYAPVLSTYMHKQGRRLSALLDLVEADIERRSRKLARSGRSTPSDQDLADMGIELIVIDEAADYLDTNTPNQVVKELAEQLTVRLDGIARAGAGVGIYLVLAVQDPKKGMIDTRLIANMLERWALRCADATSANAVLGSGSVGKGMRPQDITRAQAPLGIRKGAEGEILTRAYMIDQNDRGEAAQIIARAVELRRQVGALPGQQNDPIEDALIAATGYSTVRGGIDGLGDPAPAGQPTGQGGGRGGGILAELLEVFAANSDPERMRTAELLAGLADREPGTWSPAALGVDPDDTAGYVRTGGGELRKAINAELDGTGRSLPARSWTAGGRANGYYLADVRTATGIAPV